MKRSFLQILHLALIVLAAGLLQISCSLYDDSALKEEMQNVNDRVDKIEDRVAALEQLCNRMNDDISSLQVIVTALQENDYVKSIVPITQNQTVIGYTIVFSKSGTVNIYHGTDGKDGVDGNDGADGKDGYTPVIGVKKDVDGVYYWTIDGEWLLDENGNKVKAVGTDGQKGDKGDDGDKGADGEDGKDGEAGKDGQSGVTPKLKIENDMWFVSYDGGKTWEELGSVTSSEGNNEPSSESIFKDVDTSDLNYVKFILADGTEILVPSYSAFLALSEKVDQANANITAVQEILKAVQEKDYVESVKPIYDEEENIIGYIIHFVKAGDVTVYHGIDGEDGKNGYTPVVGVKQDTDGVYYWTIDGEWLLDDNGDKVKAVGTDGQNGDKGDDGEPGVTPQLKIENDLWYVSYDGGKNWKDLGRATGSDGDNGNDGDSFFNDVDFSDPDCVKFILADGTEIVVPSYAAFLSLAAEVSKLNQNIVAIQEILTALQDKDYVNDIEPIYDADAVIGYRITFTKSGDVTIYHGKDGVDGQPGTPGLDAVVPTISIAKHSDGVYYWKIGDEWLLDEDGNMVCAEGKTGEQGTPGASGNDGVTPQFDIIDGYWYVSYNGGESWVKLDKATGEKGEDAVSLIQDIDYDSSYLYITLSDGYEIAIPLEAGAVSNRISSVVYVPTHEDSKSRVSFFVPENSELVISYQFSPKEIVAEIADNFESMLALRSVGTITKSAQFTDLEILNCDGDSETGVLTVTASCEALGEAFFAREVGASVSLSIYDDLKEVNTAYVPLVPEEQEVPYNEIWYVTTDGQPVSVSNNNYADKWGVSIYGSSIYADSNKLLSNVYEKGFGKLKFQYSVENIPAGAFDYAKNLKKLVAPKGLKMIQFSAFENCTSLEEFVIPESVISLGTYSFMGCSNMKKFEGKFASEDGKYLLADGVLVAYLPSAADKDFIVPDGTTEIGAYAFYHCTNLVNVTMPESLNVMGQSAFLGATNLKSINIPSGVASMYDVFRDCTSLTDVTLNEGLRTIDIETFDNCTSLVSLTIPSTVTKIGSDAFGGCTNLKSLFFKSTTPPQGGYVMFPDNGILKIYVPNGYTYDYKNKDEYWAKYASKLIDFDYNSGLSGVDYNQCSDFYSYTFITYVENEYIVNESSGDYYVYRSNFPDHTSAKHAAVALSFKLNATTVNDEWFLISDNDEDGLVLTKDGLEFRGSHSTIKYTWSEIGVSSINDYMKIEINLIKKVFKVNDNVCEYKFGNISEIPILYFFGEYYHEREEGDDYDVYYGLPEGSRLYYAKAWDKDGMQTYIGYKSSAKNSSTGVTEDCWRWHTATESGYDFAYYASGITGRQPYGSGSGF